MKIRVAGLSVTSCNVTPGQMKNWPAGNRWLELDAQAWFSRRLQFQEPQRCASSAKKSAESNKESKKATQRPNRYRRHKKKVHAAGSGGYHFGGKLTLIIIKRN